MNLVDELLKADPSKSEELKTDVFESYSLAKILGLDGSIKVKVQQISERRVHDITAYQVKSNGKPDFSKVFDAELMFCTEGVVDPDLRNKDLQKHFGCSNAKELAEKLFSGEVSALSDAISVLSGRPAVEDDDVEDEVKN